MADNVAKALEERRDALIESMIQHNREVSDVPPEETRQFLEGFFGLVLAAAGGDTGPRDTYLNTVIPGIRAAGMGLDVVMAGMVKTAMPLAAGMPSEHQAWLVTFCAEYTADLIRIWEGGG